MHFAVLHGLLGQRWKPMETPFEWPLRCFPVIERAGWVPFSSRNMLREYSHPTVALHQHDYAGRVTIGGLSFDLQPGDVTITPPQVISFYELSVPGAHRYVHFRPEARTCTGRNLALPLHVKRAELQRTESVQERMRAISEWFDYGVDRGEEEWRVAGGALLQELLILLTKRVDPESQRRGSPRSEACIDRIKERIDRDYTRELRVGELAEASGLSRNYFSRRFRERFGVTVEGYVLRQRIEAAKHHLATSELCIKEVAYECGIPDANYFNKQFRRVVGESPSQFRIRARRQEW